MKVSFLSIFFVATAVTGFQSNHAFLRLSSSFRSAATLSMADGQYDFDIAIVGCGVGGHGAALHARAQDLKTAVFAGGDVGGTCVNRSVTFFDSIPERIRILSSFLTFDQFFVCFALAEAVFPLRLFWLPLAVFGK